jgi:hypothetical protein
MSALATPGSGCTALVGGRLARIQESMNIRFSRQLHMDVQKDIRRDALDAFS